MATWEEIAQDWGGRILDAGIQYGVTNPFEIDKLRLKALGDAGYYDEGQASAGGNAGGRLVLPTGWLLIGGVVLLVFLLKD